MFVVILVSFAALVFVFSLQRVPSLNLSFVNGSLLMFAASALVTLVIYKAKQIDVREAKDIALLGIRYLHYCVLVFTNFYVFLYSPTNDIIYLVLMGLLNAHWLLYKGECCLTYYEKRLIDRDYILGSEPYRHVWLSILFGKYLNVFMVFMTLLNFVNASIVIRRYFVNKLIQYLIIFSLFTTNLYFNISRLSKPNV